MSSLNFKTSVVDIVIKFPVGYCLYDQPQIRLEEQHVASYEYTWMPCHESESSSEDEMDQKDRYYLISLYRSNPG
jgi:hypothetical protein